MMPDRPWKVLYEAAMLELNPARLRDSIDAARSAMERHLEGLRTAGTNHNGNSAEMHEIADALQNLKNLERLECGTPTDEHSGTAFQGKAS